MVCLRSVCLVTLMLAGVAVRETVVHPPGWMQTAMRTAHVLNKGVSVQMAVTKNAVPMRAADDSDAWIVTVTVNGRLYFGVHEETADGLAEAMKGNPRNRQAKLYIKADARAPFANVRKALEVSRKSMFDAPALLTSQPASHGPGVMVPPMGLEISTGSTSSDAIVVDVIKKDQSSVEVKIDNQVVALTALQATLSQLLQARSARVVELKADGSLPFGEVIQVIDGCRGAGAKVAVESPTV